MKLTRDFWKPRRYDVRILPKNVEAEIFLINTETARGMRYIAECFGGKRAKPDFNYSFADEAKRAEFVANYISNLQSDAERKAKNRAERNAFEHTLNVGDILYSSWGYDQTNVDFYQVTEVVGKKSVRIREIAQERVDAHTASENVVAVKDAFLENRGEYDKRGNEMLKRVGKGNVIRLNSYSSAYPWDGKPKYQTAFGFGH